MKARFYYRNLKARYRDQVQELRALLSAIRPGDTVFDVGTNKGNYLWWLSRAVRSGQVIALEPQPSLARYLAAVVERCRLHNVTVSPVAASDRDGTAVLRVPGDSHSPGASLEQAVCEREPCRSIEVPLVTLDGILPETTRRVAALKIDVEGHELAVFRGAGRILAEHAPLLVFECENRHLASHTVADVLRYLAELGYTGSFVQRHRLVPVEEFDSSAHQKETGDRFWDAPDYCNNFILRRTRDRR